MKIVFKSLIFALILSNTALFAKGFKVHDLRNITVDTSTFMGGEFLPRSEEDRFSLLCPDCKNGITGISVYLDKSEDGTEARYRSGKTTIKMMEEKCQERSPTCTLKAVKLGNAVGWITQYPLSATLMGSTIVLFQDSDMLTMRSIAPTRGIADNNADAALKVIAPLIISK